MDSKTEEDAADPVELAVLSVTQHELTEVGIMFFIQVGKVAAGLTHSACLDGQFRHQLAFANHFFSVCIL